MKFHEPKPREITLAQQNWLRNYLNQFERALYASDWLSRTGTSHYSHFIDADSFVDNHWIVEFPKQIDGYRLSNYFHKDRGGKVKMDPIWDWNLSFGNADYLEGANPTGWYYTLIDENAHIWLRRLMNGTPSSGGQTGDPDFNQRIADRWSVLRTNLFAASNLLARVDELAAQLDEAQVRDFARWPRLGAYVWPNPPLLPAPHLRRHHHQPEELDPATLQLDRPPVRAGPAVLPRRGRRVARLSAGPHRPDRNRLLHDRRFRSTPSRRRGGPSGTPVQRPLRDQYKQPRGGPRAQRNEVEWTQRCDLHR
ncbi:MAG: CotH kinase family protein [Verrucomicrobia bacterium]|nr:CotH kinase family protein [Verrucomicrobiota bacterium]